MSNETDKGQIEYPNIVERFREVSQKLGIKKSDGYVDHCAKGDLEDLEDVEQKLYEMGLHPSPATSELFPTPPLGNDSYLLQGKPILP
jgi:hypothetical protein